MGDSLATYQTLETTGSLWFDYVHTKHPRERADDIAMARERQLTQVLTEIPMGLFQRDVTPMSQQ